MTTGSMILLQDLITEGCSPSERARRYATAFGSRAATLRGRVGVARRFLGGAGKRWAQRETRVPSWEWLAGERIRKSFAEAKRAAVDRTYRKRVQGRLRRALAPWFVCSLTAVTEGLARRRKRAGDAARTRRQAELWASGERCSFALEVQGEFAANRAKDRVPLPRGCAELPVQGRLTKLPGHTQQERRELSPRSGVSWEVVATVAARPHVEEDQDHEVLFKSSGHVCRCPHLFRRSDLDVRHASHVLALPSYVLAVGNGQRLLWRFGLREGSVDAPIGWSWKVDDEGMALVSESDQDADCHISAEYLVGPYTVDEMAEHALLQADRRRAARALREAEMEELRGVAVCWKDARRLGHCAEGVRSWARRHGIDTRRHFPADLLVRKHGDDSRVRTIATAALARHRREIERGYSYLEDHATAG